MRFIIHKYPKTFKENTVFDIVFVDTFVDACVGEDLVEEFVDFNEYCMIRFRIYK